MKAVTSNGRIRKASSITVKPARISSPSATISFTSNRTCCRWSVITCIVDVLDLPSGVHSCPFDGVIIPFDELELRSTSQVFTLDRLQMQAAVLVMPSNGQEMPFHGIALRFDVKEIEADGRIMRDDTRVSPSNVLDPPSTARGVRFDLPETPSTSLSLPSDVQVRRFARLACRSNTIGCPSDMRGCPFDRQEIDDDGGIAPFGFTVMRAAFTIPTADIRSIASL